jgi:hypothetical protein
MGIVAESFVKAKGSEAFIHREHGTGGEIKAYADDAVCIDPCFFYHLTHRFSEGIYMVTGVLISTVFFIGIAKSEILFFHYAIGKGTFGNGKLCTVIAIDKDGSCGKCAEIDTLIEKKTSLLEEMEALKKSTIFEYVTGKKEVAI